MKSTESIGAKFIALAAFIIEFSNLEYLDPVNCVHVRENWTAAYTKKNMHAMIMVHATAGAGGGIVSPGHVPAGGTKVTAP
jgi:hypothetical protein